MTGFKKNNPDCVCCEEETQPGDPCGLFNDNFNRADSSTVGNGWAGSGSIISDELQIGGTDIFQAGAQGGPGKLIRAACWFSGTAQEFRIYWGSNGNYVGYRLTNYDSSTKKQLYIFSGGSVKSAVEIPGLVNVVGRRDLSVCITSTQVTAFVAGVSVSHAPSGSMPTGIVGVGGRGSFSNGAIRVDDFSVRIVSDACHSCGEVECLDCSGAFSWLVDLSGFTGMVPAFRPDSLVNCFECPNGFGSYVLEPSSPCTWFYNERFCDGYDGSGIPCSHFSLRITITTDPGDPCSGRLSVTLQENLPCENDIFTSYGQTASYSAQAHALDTPGTGAVTFQLDPADQTFGYSSDSTSSVLPICVADYIVDPGGVDPYTALNPPQTITATRIG